MERVKISYYTDALCVWAYFAQVRIDELKENFKDSIEIDCRYFHIFGNVTNKMKTAWRERGGLPGYRQHVGEIVERFNHVTLHEQTWETNVPKSSMPAHLFLCATRHVEACFRSEPGSGDRLAWALREAFFRQARDISQRKVLFEIAESIGLPALRETNRSLRALRCFLTRVDNVLPATSAIGSLRQIFVNCWRARQDSYRGVS
jgi:predicted DsbA family dithiol-disulfide isomerase